MKNLRVIGPLFTLLLIVGQIYCQDNLHQDVSATDAIQWTDDDRAAMQHWQAEIEKLEARDATTPHNEDAILFIGSSSIRLWDSIAQDMAPYRVIQRGFGGAKFRDLAFFADRLIQPHVYRAIAVFIANDVSGSDHDYSPDQVEVWARHVISVSRRHRPEAPLFLIEVTPTKNRLSVWDRTREINARLREIALTTPHVYFIPTAEYFMTAEGLPRTELFVKDQLHLNEAGYDQWADLIRRRITEVLRNRADLERN